ncbi:MAG: BT_3928 family protein, partial [Flavisolibacter sp.]
MKIAIRTIQILVAVLFIISGLVKANDPLGLSYKMEEFFEIWNTSLAAGNFFAKDLLTGFFSFLHGYSILLSIIMITLEIMAGIALLFGWSRKLVLWLLLLLILFFTFLTGYALFSLHPDGSPKFTNCGCFGDCLPITPKTSFLKDLALLVMIVLLLFGKKWMMDFFSTRTKTLILSASLFSSLLLQWYVLNYLPIVDCLPFKRGNNISEKMKQPPGSYGDSTAIRYIYEKDGKRYEWDWTELPADFETYTYIDRIDKLVRKGNAEPPIKNFSLTGAEVTDSVSGEKNRNDSTLQVLEQPFAIIGFGLGKAAEKSWLEDFREVIQMASRKNIPVYFATNERERLIRFFKDNGISVQVFALDFTNIRTAARTQPGFY